MTTTATQPTKIQAEALRNLHAGHRNCFRSVRTQNALAEMELIYFDHGRGWVLTDAGLDAIGVPKEGREKFIPQSARNAAPGEFVALAADNRGSRYNVWHNQEIVAVILNESAAGLDGDVFSVWSAKAGNPEDIIGIANWIPDALDAVRELHKAAEEEPQASGRPAEATGSDPLFTLTYQTDQGMQRRENRTAHGVEAIGRVLMRLADRMAAWDIAVLDAVGEDVTGQFACFQDPAPEPAASVPDERLLPDGAPDDPSDHYRQ